MANLTIRNLDDDVVKELKAQAKANHRSLEAELRAILSNEARRLTAKDARALANRIAAMSPKGVEQTDSVELLREDRDR